MFVGHLALAFGAKRSLPRTSLGWLMAAVTAADLLWPLFLLLGIERVTLAPGATPFTSLVFDAYPWSHSLLMDLVWGAGLGLLALLRGDSRHVAFWLGALVVSHWVLDVISHAPDMPLWPGPSPKLGFGLWNSIPATFLVEGLLWIGGLAMYLRARRPSNWTGWVALGTFFVVTTAIWADSPWTPLPPSPHALAWFALIGWLLIPWALWIDRTWQLSAAS
jgi:hypothetical protein